MSSHIEPKNIATIQFASPKFESKLKMLHILLDKITGKENTATILAASNLFIRLLDSFRNDHLNLKLILDTANKRQYARIKPLSTYKAWFMDNGLNGYPIDPKRVPHGSFALGKDMQRTYERADYIDKLIDMDLDLEGMLELEREVIAFNAEVQYHLFR
jgi:hypothetical protein